MRKKRRAECSIAEELGGITWEYEADKDDSSMFQPMSDYFDHFPWRGDPRATEIEEAMEKKADEDESGDTEINI